MPRLRAGLLALGTALVLTLASCSASPDDAAAPSSDPSTGGTTSSDDGGGDVTTCEVRRPLGPDSGAWLGVSLDWDHDTPAKYAARLGEHPAVVVSSASMPLTDADVDNVDGAARLAAEQGAVLLLTLEPNDGLRAVGAAAVDALVKALQDWNAAGAPVVVRFGPDMNGSWYPWGQQPKRFKRAFRTVADAVHADVPGSATMWAPAYGGGYPFVGGQYEAIPGGRAAVRLDRDLVGDLGPEDDPYAPYYPGDEAVDWVGMSLFHWGTVYPWGENEPPARGKLVAQLRGRYAAGGVDERRTPDFYRLYGERRGKPVALVETAALYAPGNEGATETRVKAGWIRQVLAPDLLDRLPQLRLVDWFEWNRDEQEIGGRVDWTATRRPAVRQTYRDALPGWAVFGDPDAPRC